MNNNYTPLPEPIPITEQIWPEGTVPLVCTSTLAYNHEPYIRECLDGILMQKTTFPIQVLIHEDCSTDRTIEILKEYEAKYPNIIKVYYQPENIYRMPAEEQQKRKAEFLSWEIGKYTAICEGDDYWIDPLKLQKQVDFLEENEEYVLCCTNVQIFNQKNKKLYLNQIETTDLSYFDLLMQNQVYTLTALYRSSIYKDYFDEISKDDKKNWKMGDYPLWLWLANKGKVRLDNSVTSVYRIADNSATHQINKSKRIDFFKSVFDIVDYFVEKYPISKDQLELLYKKRANSYIKKSVLLNDFNLYKEGINQKKQIKSKITLFDRTVFLFLSNSIGRIIISLYLKTRRDVF